MANPPQQGAVPITNLAGTNNLVINSDGSINVDSQAAVSASGTLQANAAANGNGSTLSCLGDASTVFTVNMSGFTGIVNFEGSEDGTNFSALEANQLGTTAVGPTAIGSTTTGIFLYVASCANLQLVRARVSNFSAGTVTVTAHALPLPASVEVLAADLAVAGTPTTAPADSQALASTIPATQMGQTGTGVVSVERVANKILNVPGTAITSGTPVSIWTPQSGKKFRVLGYHLSNTVAGSIILKDGATGPGATEFMRTPIQAINTGTPSPPLGNGYISTAVNNQLWLDVTASGTIHGFVVGIEE